MRVDAWLHRARAALQTSLAALWPPQCVLCGGAGQRPDRDLCAGCEMDLPRNDHCCSVCAEPLQSAIEGLVCGACLRHPPRFDRCVAPYRYAYPLDHMVRALKYGSAVAHGRVLADVFARSVLPIEREAWPEILLPVPLGRARFIKRGYNQALELATHLARELAIPLHTDVLVRARDTREQAGLDRKARRKNLRNAFALVRPLPAAHVAIVDDVVTTGSTANEIARVLKRAGAEKVEVWAIARAGRG
jgi:ComF family protein